jgi:hypothetical protein
MSEISVDRVLQLEQEFHAAKETTIKQLLERQQEIADQLRLLGHEPKALKAVHKRKPCSKCQSTDHDARFHVATAHANDQAERPLHLFPALHNDRAAAEPCLASAAAHPFTRTLTPTFQTAAFAPAICPLRMRRGAGAGSSLLLSRKGRRKKDTHAG